MSKEEKDFQFSVTNHTSGSVHASVEKILDMYYTVMKHTHLTKDEVDKMPFYQLQEYHGQIEKGLSKN